MTTFAIVACCSLVAMAVMQAVFAVVFARLFRRPVRSELPDQQLPKASVLLSLRGADPHLANGLRRLMAQNYPDYDLRIVVDSEDDPSWNVVQDAVRETGCENVFVSPLKQRRETCSLKCNALVQLAEGLDEATEIVVLADADLVSHDDWMRELIVPLVEDGLGATYGNRWFWPRQARLGSLVRYLWNVAAVVPMYIFKIPWGGTFAMRASILRDSGLLEKWSRAVVEDAPVRSALEEAGLDIRFVPSLMMVNREECSVPFSLDFIKRQLTWTKIYHPRWAPVVVHAFCTTGVILGGILATVLALLTGNLVAFGWAAAGSAFYAVMMLLLLAMLEVGVRRVVARRGEPLHRFGVVAQLRMLFAIPLTQGIHMCATLLAVFRKYVAWRGVTYEVRGPWDIRMVGYQPFEQPEEAVDSNVSL